uniref:Uncharacterized protein n=1 Tax=Arundo donax TaxID=35708 RepID=A0A0A9FR73_ARUDO
MLLVKLLNAISRSFISVALAREAGRLPIKWFMAKSRCWSLRK